MISSGTELQNHPQSQELNTISATNSSTPIVPLTPAERQQLLVEWNQTETDYPRHTCVHTLFEQQVERTPDAVAVVFERQQLTYRELNARANQLAYYLGDLGVGPETLVALYTERSCDLIVGILGILKAGGAYLPIDAACPTERLQFMLADAKVTVVLTQSHLASSLSCHEARILCLDADWETVARFPTQSATNRATAANLAYVIYTSGSTGKPKGVEIIHANVVRLMHQTEGWFHFDSCDVWTLFHSPAFDFSVWEIWGALFYGGKLVVVPYLVSRSPEDFLDLLLAEGVTVLNQTPSAFRQLMRTEEQIGDRASQLALRTVIFGGEALDFQSLRPWFDRHDETFPQLVNMYGITETTVHVTYYPIRAADISSGKPSLIGAPIPDLRLYVLDERGHAVPMEIPGELYIGGDGVARGYLNCPELTNERFVPDSFSDLPGQRLYRTGDRVRRLSDGNLEYLGRLDNQIKIRGFRIELGEIESALLAFRGMREAVVAAREEGADDKRLVAYCVMTETPSELSTRMRSFLQSRLPDYMIPSHFVMLDALPLTPNGKVDRNALAQRGLDFMLRPSEADYVAPQTPTEDLLTQIWSEVLRVPNVGVTDNFFTLGGHSLLAARLVSQVRNVLGIELSLSEFFAVPTVAQLAAHIEARHEDSVFTAPILPAATLVISPMQHWLAYACFKAPQSPRYNIPMQLRLHGNLNIMALQQALQAIIARHETLRSAFTHDGEVLTLTIREDVAVDLPVQDLSELPQTQRERQAQTQSERSAQRSFDLSNDLLVRAQLWRLDAGEHLLLLNIHHIVFDGWSQNVLMGELATLYNAFVAGTTADLPALPLRYRDYAQWRQQWSESADYPQQLDYWNRKLKGTPALLELPTDRPRLGVRGTRGGQVPLNLSPELTEGVRHVSREAGGTLFMTLLAAWQVLLGRYSGQDDFIVYIPMAGRTRPETEGLIGYFINMLPLRADLSGAPDFRELLGRVRETTLDAFAYQNVAMEQLEHVPRLQAMFVLQNTPDEELRLHGLETSLRLIPTGTAKYELSLDLEETTSGLWGWLEYDADLYDEATVERMAGHYRTLLEGIAADPYTPLSELPLLPHEEQQQLLVEWNLTETDYPRDTCVHTLFEQQVERTPDAVAVVFEQQQLTYQELNVRANQLAHFLQEQGVGPESLVGLCVERSLDMVVGILGILKAGGAYVPLDPSYPPERLTFMLEDTAAPVLLTQSSLLERLAESPPQSVVCLDTLAEHLTDYPDSNPICEVTAEQLVYVMYTSGSTGRPKGVCVLHKGVVRLVDWSAQVFSSEDIAGMLAATSLSFDPSVFELFVALCRGGSVILAENALALPDLLAAERVTFVNTVPSLMTEILREGQLPASVRVVALAGEALPGALVEQVYAQETVERVYNLYGPTETVYTTYVHIPRGSSARPPIGCPIGNTQVYVLDAAGQPVPIGVAGELYIGGDGLAREYLNRPELTEERFVADPFSDEVGACLYRTGDRVCWLADGNLDYLGRLDHQVKIRGYRVELGEIEAVLTGHPSVEQAVVVTREDGADDLRLVAYVSVQPASETSRTDLRIYVKEHLPDYMAPSYFMLLDALPLTPNGKIDRRALPAPDFTLLTLDTEYAAPQTPMEELLAQIWREVLHLNRIGIHHDFFAYGGHSLLALQVVTRVRSVLAVEISLREFFAAPTIAQLAAQIERQRSGPSDGLAPPIPPATTLTVSPMQRWLGYACAKDPDSPVYNLPYLLRLTGVLHVTALQRALQAVVDRHEVLRSTFTSEGEALRLTIREEAAVDLPLQDLSDLPEAEREGRAQAESERLACRSFDLGQDLLIRAQLWRLDSDTHWLLLNIHHLVFDGWSQSVLMRELATCYNAIVAGTIATLPDLPIRYRDYAQWRQEELESADYPRQLEYWNQKLEGTPDSLELPTDRARSTVRGTRGGQIEMNLTPELTERVRWLSQEMGVTLFMTLFGVWQILLGRYSGQDDFVVCIPTAGRNRPETEGLIGYFINVLPLRADLSGDPTARILLKRVRETTLDAFANQDVAMEQVRHVPRLQVLFGLQNMPDEELSLLGLEASLRYIPTATARYELSLDFEVRASGLCGWIEYDADLFDTATVVRMARHYRTLLESVTIHSDTPLSQLPLLTPDEQHQLLVEWNQTETDTPRDSCLHTLFEQQVERSPDAVALVFQEEQHTYRELNARANQLAHFLQEHGVGTETLVGLCVERSIEMVVGLLGILKAGGAYVPLDPAHPADRLAFVLKDAGVPLLLTQSGLAAQLSASGTQIVCLDTEWERIALKPEAMPISGVKSGNLAYVIYTSGSTGKPKGVCIEHRSVSNIVASMLYELAMTPSDRLVAVTTLSFDIAALEIFLPLLSGASLLVAPDETARDGVLLGHYLLSHQATVLQATPATWQMLRIGPRLPRGLKALCGGEALPSDLAERLLDQECRLWNVYGPTETTIWSTCCPVERGPITIGRPIANTQVYVLDANRQPVPVGVPGELYIGGDGLARGYLNRPELTAEKFVSHPFSVEAGARLYRTGDQVCWRTDGNLEFLGRLDHQMKIRGFRIEPGEIETALNTHCRVQQVAVVAWEDPTGDKRLVAYVAPVGETDGLEAQLRAVVQETLPEYMVPSHFVLLDALPLTPNGKIDYKSLAQRTPDIRHAAMESPRDDLECQLADLWARVLGVSALSMTDSFFALGGHSLLAIRLLQQVNQEFSVRLSLAAMLKAITVREMAELVRREQEGASQWSSLVPLQPLGHRPPLFCAPPGGGSIFYYRTLAANIGQDQPLYTLEPRGMSGTMPPHDTVEETAAYYIQQIRMVQATGPYLLCGLSFGGTVAFEMARQLEAAGERIALLVLFDTWAPGYRVATASSDGSRGSRLTQALRYGVRFHRENLSVYRHWSERLVYLLKRSRRLGHRIKHGLAERRWQRDRENPAALTLPEAYEAVKQAEARARSAYRPGGYCGRVHLLRARLQFWPETEACMGWDRLVKDLEVIEVPGTHYSMLEKPCVRVAVVHLHRLLAEAQENTSIG